MIIGIDASNLRRGGGLTHIIELMQAADPERDGFDSVVIWGGEATLSEIQERDWLQKILVPALNEGLLKRVMWQRFELSKCALVAGCDVLFVPGGSYTGDFRPVVTMCRNMLPFEWAELKRFGFSLVTIRYLLLRFFQSRSFKGSDGVIFLTSYAKQKVQGVTGNVSSACVIPHGINDRFFIDRKLGPAGFGATQESIVRLLYVSIVNRYKHQWSVVEGVAMARRTTGLDLRLTLVGPSFAPSLRRLRSAIETYDKDGCWVTYLGSVPYKDLHQLYASADIGIFASSCENMPNILLESMAAAVPIACSNKGPMPEILGDAGEYFDPEDPSSIENAITALLYSASRRQDLAAAAVEIAKDYSWGRCAKHTFEFLIKVASINRL